MRWMLCAVVAGCSSSPTAMPDAACMIPDANYSIAVTPQAGTCPSDLLSELQTALDDANQSHTVQSGACRELMGTMFATGTSRVCMLTVSFSATGTASGLEDGSGTLSAMCQDNTSCTQELAITFTRP